MQSRGGRGTPRRSPISRLPAAQELAAASARIARLPSPPISSWSAWAMTATPRRGFPTPRASLRRSTPPRAPSCSRFGAGRGGAAADADRPGHPARSKNRIADRGRRQARDARQGLRRRADRGDADPRGAAPGDGQADDFFRRALLSGARAPLSREHPVDQLSFSGHHDAGEKKGRFRGGSIMFCARSLLLIGLASAAISWRRERPARSCFRFRAPRLRRPRAIFRLTPIPIIRRPGGFDKDVDMSLTTRKEVADPTHEPPGTLTIKTGLRKLYLSLPGGRAIEYGIGVGRQGFAWKGKAEIGRKAFWPGWTPPPEMMLSPPRPARPYGRRHGKPARRARALSVSGQEGHAVPHPRHQRAQHASATPSRPAASACWTPT